MASLAAHQQAQQVVQIQPNRFSAQDKRGVAIATEHAAAEFQQQQNVNLTPKRFSAETKQTGSVKTEQGTVQLQESEKLAVEDISGTRKIINGYYNRTNFYINVSRDYVGGATLTRYINFPFMVVLSVLAMVASLPSPVFFIYAFIMAAIDLCWLLLFAQHMYVTAKTMPHMLKLKRLPNRMLDGNNAFFEITLERYQAVFGSLDNAQIAASDTAKGTIQLHVLSYRAVGYMKAVMVYSTFALVVFILLIFYCGIFGIIGAAGSGFFSITVTPA